jgi:ribosome biogenesis protein BRX1
MAKKKGTKINAAKGVNGAPSAIAVEGSKVMKKASTTEAGVKKAPYYKNKEKVLVVSSRGITFRSRHLLLDILQLLPHAKKDAKLDTKTDRGVINEVADLKGCTSTIFFETRKHQDLYLWTAKTPTGPSIKFHVTNIHTMAELKLSGNHLKGSRPVLSFDANFDAEPHLQVIKGVLSQIFATPPMHHKKKPFFDHVLSFSVVDNRVWIRNYQVSSDKKITSKEDLTLIEVGPRVCMNPVKIFSGSFGGPIIYDNPEYVSPNAIRAALKKSTQSKYANKVDSRSKRKLHKEAHKVPRAPLADVFK